MYLLWQIWKLNLVEYKQHTEMLTELCACASWSGPELIAKPTFWILSEFYYRDAKLTFPFLLKTNRQKRYWNIHLKIILFNSNTHWNSDCIMFRKCFVKNPAQVQMGWGWNEDRQCSLMLKFPQVSENIFLCFLTLICPCFSHPWK